MTGSCEVCCERFNLSNRKKIECRFCPFSSCATCSEKYLLETREDAHCMSCRKGWSREVLSDNFTQKFVSRSYKQRREDLLLERERSLMPATQPFVEVEKRIRKMTAETSAIHERQAARNTRWAAWLATDLAIIRRDYGIENDQDAYFKRHWLAQQERKAASCLAIDIQHIDWCVGRLQTLLTGGRLEQERRQFVRACPYENCRGFLSTAWKCGMCDNWTCPECHEGKGPDKDAEHTCDPNNIATARLMARDTRNCPKCAAGIFKIEGCDQMYCTQCHTAFSWRTGAIETGVVHNPHYYEYQRRNGTAPRVHGDIPCGGFPDWPSVASRLGLRTVPAEPVRAMIRSAHRSHPHVYHVMIPRYTTRPNEDNRDLRIKLMIGDFGEDEFKKKIQQREKARQRKTDIRQVLEMYTTVLNDLFQAFIDNSDVPALVNSLNELKIHVNETFSKVSKRWTNCAVPRITDFYDMV